MALLSDIGKGLKGMGKSLIDSLTPNKTEFRQFVAGAVAPFSPSLGKKIYLGGAGDKQLDNVYRSPGETTISKAGGKSKSSGLQVEQTGNPSTLFTQEHSGAPVFTVPGSGVGSTTKQTRQQTQQGSFNNPYSTPTNVRRSTSPSSQLTPNRADTSPDIPKFSTQNSNFQIRLPDEPSSGGSSGFTRRETTPDGRTGFFEYDEFGNITSSTLSGAIGSSGAGGSFNFARSGQQGDFGGGGSSFTGTTGAASGLGSLSIPGPDDSTEAERFHEKKISGLSPEIQAAIQAPLSERFAASAAANPADAAMEAPVIAPRQNAGEIAANQQGTQNSFALRENDAQEELNRIFTEAKKIEAQINAAQPTPENLVVETDEMRDILDSLVPEERTTFKQMYDQAFQDLGLSEYSTAKIGTIKRINALNEAYNNRYEDIRSNPDLPQGLANRRIDSLKDEQKAQLFQLTATLEEINAAIDLGNNQLNQMMDIRQMDINEEERMQRNARAKLDLLIDAGVVGRLNEREINALSQQTGIERSVLKSIVERANMPNIEQKDFNGTLYEFEKDPVTGAITNQKVILAAPVESAGVGTGAGSAPSQTVQSWVNRVASGSANISNVPLGIRNEVVNAMDAQGVQVLSSTQRNTLSELSKASEIVGQLDSQLKQLNLGSGLLGRITKGAELFLGSQLQTSEEAALFQSLKEGLLSTLSRATGERGVLTDQDIQRARNLLPKLTDSKEVASGKMEQLEALFGAFENKAVSTFTQTFGGSGITDFGSMGQSTNPTGNLFSDL